MTNATNDIIQQRVPGLSDGHGGRGWEAEQPWRWMQSPFPSVPGVPGTSTVLQLNELLCTPVSAPGTWILTTCKFRPCLLPSISVSRKGHRQSLGELEERVIEGVEETRCADGLRNTWARAQGARWRSGVRGGVGESSEE